ncbi:PEP-CTERM sorting domain-containing protein [Sphingomonas humi]|uniref:PEP-CTERM sorting domain-containing protein n=1 Tax=Sphingomonas humi TaxID=335630 RepID=A0ABP7RX48_9SPHN
MKLGLAATFGALLLASAAPAATQQAAAPARTILFVGNSFTQGAHSAVRNWRAGSVTDLNGAGYGGVPALFKAFTEQAGLNYAVSLETQGGKSLGFHFDERRALFDKPWDEVVLQEFSTLNREKPGNPAATARDTKRLADLFQRRNPRVRINLMSTWSRADLVYKPGSRWSGTNIAAMAGDLQKASEAVCREVGAVQRVLPVGTAWTRAFDARIADPNPYDGIGFGTMGLWAYDHYHGSVAGYYLEALVVFGAISGLDPTSLGKDERAADELGLSDEQAVALQKVARDELASRRGGRCMVSSPPR